MKDLNEITEKIIRCAIEVYKQIPFVKRWYQKVYFIISLCLCVSVAN
ncbi:MAG: hypothetical protein AB1414_03820 [bacterium]